MTVPAKVACPRCGRLVSPWQLKRHATTHRDDAAPSPPAIVLVEDRPGWRCPICRSDSHARDMRQPDRCVRCATSERRP